MGRQSQARTTMSEYGIRIRKHQMEEKEIPGKRNAAEENLAKGNPAETSLFIRYTMRWLVRRLVTDNQLQKRPRRRKLSPAHKYDLPHRRG